MTRLRITVSCLMIIIAVIAVDLAVLLLSRRRVSTALAGAMPMADVLAVLLVITVGRLRRRGEAPLSHVMFLLAGGMALVVLVYLVHLRPDLVSKYFNTAWRRLGENRLLGVLLIWLAVSVPILVPALFMGWVTRGYRLKLTTRIDGQSEVASRD
jgi:hypothetical protein